MGFGFFLGVVGWWWCLPCAVIFKCPVKEPFDAHHMSQLLPLFSGKSAMWSFIRMLQSPARGCGCTLPYPKIVKMGKYPMSRFGLFSQNLGRLP